MPNWCPEKKTQNQVPRKRRQTERKSKEEKQVTGGKKNPHSAPTVCTIPAGYEVDERIVKELRRDGLPVNQANITRYKELDEEIREGELLRLALNKTSRVPLLTRPFRTKTNQ